MFPLAAVDGVIVNLSVKSSANQVKVELVIKCEHTHTHAYTHWAVIYITVGVAVLA